ncbi:MAG: hypothetical protein ABI080_14915 [Candidatus Binatia bacterium]
MICYRRTWRLVTAALVAASAVGIVLVLARIILGNPPLTVIPLLLLAVTMVAVPAAVAALLRRAFAARIGVDGGSRRG